jgi:hypothetical protein
MKGMGSERSGGGFSAAPSAVSDFLRQHIKFGGTNDTLNISGLIAIAQVGQSDTAGQFSGIVDGLGSPATAVRLSPTAPYSINNTGSAAIGAFISPALDLLGSAFTRYRCKKLKFHYRPQSGTDSTQQLVFGFAADPVHPLIASGGGYSTVPTITGLESLADSIPFAPWAPWDMDVSRKLDIQEWLYTDYDTNDNVSSSTARFSNFGAFGLIAATASTDTAVNYGVLYMSFDMDFKEFCPISVTRPSLLRLRAKLKLHAKKSLAECPARDSICSVESVSSFPSPTFQSDTKVIDLAEMVNKTQEIRKLRSDVTLEAALKAVLKDRTPTVEALRLIHESGLSHILMCEDSDHDVPVSMGFTKICKDAYKIQMG